MIRKVYITIRAVIINTGGANFKTMGIGKKTILGIDIAKKGFGFYFFRDKPKAETGVYFLARCVSEVVFVKLKNVVFMKLLHQYQKYV